MTIRITSFCYCTAADVNLQNIMTVASQCFVCLPVLNIYLFAVSFFSFLFLVLIYLEYFLIKFCVCVCVRAFTIANET